MYSFSRYVAKATDLRYFVVMLRKDPHRNRNQLELFLFISISGYIDYFDIFNDVKSSAMYLKMKINAFV